MIGSKTIKTLRSVSLLTFVLFTLPSYASPPSPPPTEWVYRFDTRPPAEIFERGFQALGNNYNFADHVRGTSTHSQNANSAFISTSADHFIAQDFAREALDGLNDGRYGYLYRIRATENFYPAEETLDYVYGVHGSEPAIWMQEAVEGEEEYCAVDTIAPAQIQSVEIMHFVDGRLDIEEQYNPGYQDIATHANEGPYTLSAFLPIEEGPVLLSTPSLMSVDFLPDLDDIELQPLFPLFTMDDLFMQTYLP